MSHVTSRELGWFPVIAAALTAAGGVASAKIGSKSADEQAKASEKAAAAQAKAARQMAKAEKASAQKWVWIGGGAVVIGLGVAAYFMLRRRKKR